MLVPPDVQTWFGDLVDCEDRIPQPVLDWFGSIIERHYRVFFSIAYGFLRDHHQAEDAVQTAAFKALRHLKALETPDAIVGWVAQITKKVCLDEIKKPGPKRTDPLEMFIVPPPAARVESHIESTIDQRMAILSELNRLPESQAVVVRLRYLEDIDIDKIAERLGIQVGAVHVRLHRALRELSKSEVLRAALEQRR
jgi:RNA polymerase sigma-70 factor (ECF subfamily)